MLSWRLHTGPEKAELQELNARLYDYVCRVRELERENLLLEEELRGRRGQEGLWAEGQARFAEEARGLRQQLDELSWATALAEGERDALRRELWELQRLGEEERAARGRLDAELGAERRELQEALGARAALEALLGRLQAERRGLEAAHERDVRELRARAARLTKSYRAPGPARPPPRLREVHDSYALLVAESWRETAQLYEDEVRELEEALRRGQDSRREAEEETRLCAQEAEALRREALELEQLRALLEEELRRVREEYELQAEERQRVIACLEDEKAALTLAMADRLRDYQELVQVKTSLSLEVATYRALLEGESNPEVLVLTERIENVPQELRSTSYRCASSVLQRENERNLFARQKAPMASFSHSLVQHPHLPAQPVTAGAAGRGFRGSEYSSRTTTRQETTYEETADSREKTSKSQTNFRTFSPAHSLLRDPEAPAQTFPERLRTTGTKDASAREARESTVAQKSYRQQWDDGPAGASRSTWSSERTVIVGKKTEANGTREQDRNRPETVQTKREEKVFDSKEKASEERNLRWEELTKLDKETRKRESQQLREQGRGKESAQEKSVREREVPISLGVSRESVPQEAPKACQTPPEEDAPDGTGRGVETREARFRMGPDDIASPPKGESTTETIAENIVSSILKQFTQAPDAEASADAFPDTKVTYVDRKELAGDRQTKTEIVVESRLTEEVDVSDEAGLEYLLSKDVKEVDLKGKSAERMIGDIINVGLKGREGRARVVNVEITEEPVSYISGEKAEEFSIPFKVEEVDDVSPGSKGLVDEGEGYGGEDTMFSGNRHKETKCPQEDVTHVEEVTEAGDSEGGEQSYFVSTPDEHPGGQNRDEGSVYGQIHIEEESTIRYSWQDEILPGTRRKTKRDDGSGETVVRPPDVLEAPLEEDVGHTHWQEQTRSGEFHAEPTVIEKEIKIPPDFHTSIKGAFKEPRHQLVEVIGQLEESLPERVKEELSALAREGQGGPENMSIDVKKVHTSGGRAVTLVAEVNLSKTVDANQLDLEELSKDEAGEIEKAVESVVQDSVAERHSPAAPGSPDRESAAEAPAAGLRFRRWATQELYHPSGEEDDAGRASPGTEPATSQGPVSATVEVTSPRGFGQSHVLEDVSRSVQRVQIGPTGVWRTEHVSREGPTAEVVEVDVSNVEVTPRWTRETTVFFPAGTEAAARGGPDRDAWRDGGSGKAWVAGVSSQGSAGAGHQVPGEKGKEQAEFDRTVQLQRVVDRRSVISDEKKVALLYLDTQEEDSEGRWF
ncbi:synemin isoform X3 [Mirounga angustirostris]|uniref:synemin isoform X3 n=1 Tax=Mirounga angustirostris TaxID=9716 RepID=UPI00313D432A